jgi:serpin B
MRLMNRRTRLMVVTGMAFALLPPLPAAAQDDARALTEAYNASGLALFQKFSRAPGNIVLSPFSIGTAMAMALSGARGETEREMAGVLKQRLDRRAMEAANGAVLSALHAYDKSAAPKCSGRMRASGAHCEGPLSANGECAFPAEREGDRCVASGSFSPSARLLTANALMLTGQPGDLITADYAALLKGKYDAEIFSNAGLDDVNGWVRRKTEGKIERILEQLDRSTAAVILNAVYFQAKWGLVFDKAATTDGAFNLSRPQKISVPMMRRQGHFALAARPGYRAIRLPYDVGAIGMVIVLPNEIDGLAAVSRRLDANEWAPLVAALNSPDAVKATELAVPRFKASFDASLVSQFQEAGMKRAFDPKLADFSGMTGRPAVQLAIGTIKHRAVIEVTEDGTEAAAATAVSIVAGAARRPPEKPDVFHVDRPFLFAIVDEASGAMLFQGRILDPR